MEISVLMRYVTFFNTEGTVEYKGNTIATIGFNMCLSLLIFKIQLTKKKKKIIETSIQYGNFNSEKSNSLN